MSHRAYTKISSVYLTKASCTSRFRMSTNCRFPHSFVTLNLALHHCQVLKSSRQLKNTLHFKEKQYKTKTNLAFPSLQNPKTEQGGRGGVQQWRLVPGKSSRNRFSQQLLLIEFLSSSYNLRITRSGVFF